MAGGNGDVVDQTGVTGTNDGKKGKTGGKNGGKKGKKGKKGKNGGKFGLIAWSTLADPITPAVTEAVAVHADPAAKLPLARIIV
jgi:hypothetical protein